MLFVTAMKRKTNPIVMMWVTHDEKELTMHLDDFLQIMKDEIGSVATTFTKDAFEKRFDAAAEVAINALKNELRKAV